MTRASIDEQDLLGAGAHDPRVRVRVRVRV